MAKQKILIIEDEPSLVEILSYNLINEGYDVASSGDGNDGLRLAKSVIPDLIILDLMLPGTDGLEVCRQLRSDPSTENISIIMLTAKSEEVDEIVGFNMGADDYVTKPFKIKPLIQRIKAILRRPPQKKHQSDSISIHGIEINRLKHFVKLHEEEIQLTLTEFKLLWSLAKNPGRTYSRAELMDISRGDDANALERTIDVHVRSLRHKLNDHAQYIETIRGIGYRFKSLN